MVGDGGGLMEGERDRDRQSSYKIISFVSSPKYTPSSHSPENILPLCISVCVCVDWIHFILE